MSEHENKTTGQKIKGLLPYFAICIVLIIVYWLLSPVGPFAEEEQHVPADTSVDTVLETHETDGEALEGEHMEEGEEGHGDISIYWAIPFACMLLSIAFFPLFAPKFWHHNYWKVGLIVFCIPMAITCAFFLGDHVMHNALHEAQSYISFILLLASLFTISGGIYLKGSLVGKPVTNTAIIAIGTVLASFMATTGASMLLIRPLLRAIKGRKHKVHIIVFFIFCVSNIGGLLTPLGDPPLFLGYLKGVPFEWTLLNLIPEWLFVNGILVALFFVIDSILYKKEVKNGEFKPDENSGPKEKISIQGGMQFILLAGVVLSIYFQGFLQTKFDWWPGFGPQEAAMLSMMLLSLVVAKPKSEVRAKNEFTWFPIKEVAALFAGIFACMIPALYYLELHGSELISNSPAQFFWFTGGLSSFLDNAPTYLVFLEAGQSVVGAPGPAASVMEVVHQYDILAAVSCGAVFMGANTYIGNAPNFMVRSIAEEGKVKMPSFFGYMIYSVGILVPIFLIVNFIFFDGEVKNDIRGVYTEQDAEISIGSIYNVDYPDAENDYRAVIVYNSQNYEEQTGENEFFIGKIVAPVSEDDNTAGKFAETDYEKFIRVDWTIEHDIIRLSECETVYESEESALEASECSSEIKVYLLEKEETEDQASAADDTTEPEVEEEEITAEDTSISGEWIAINPDNRLTYTIGDIFSVTNPDGSIKYQGEVVDVYEEEQYIIIEVESYPANPLLEGKYIKIEWQPLEAGSSILLYECENPNPSEQDAIEEECDPEDQGPAIEVSRPEEE